jgi:hypothetical protein
MIGLGPSRFFVAKMTNCSLCGLSALFGTKLSAKKVVTMHVPEDPEVEVQEMKDAQEEGKVRDIEDPPQLSTRSDFDPVTTTGPLAPYLQAQSLDRSQRLPRPAGLTVGRRSISRAYSAGSKPNNKPDS